MTDKKKRGKPMIAPIGGFRDAKTYEKGGKITTKKSDRKKKAK